MPDIGFWRRTRIYPHRTAIVDETGAELTAGHLLRICNRISNKLVRSGVKPREVVATLLPSSADLVAIVLATRQIGLYLLPLNPRAKPDELDYLIRDSNPRQMIAGSACNRTEVKELILARMGPDVTWIEAGVDIDRRLGRLTDGMPDTSPVHRVCGDILAYTSGTTGIPKAVLRNPSGLEPEDTLQTALEWYTAAFGIDCARPGAFLSACPIFFPGPLSFASYALHLGRSLALMPQWNARLALSMIERHRITETFLVPYQLSDLINAYQRKSRKYDISSLKCMILGSAPCPADLKDRALDTFGEIVYESYGSTEVAGAVATPADARNHRGTVGRAIAPHEMKIVNDRGCDAGPGEIGRVFMKMLPGMEFSYKADPASTAKCQLGNFATAGDLGFLNKAGYLFLAGRDSDLINCRGEKVRPSVVERVALSHPNVEDAAAFGVRCAESGETVNLAVRLSSGTTAMEEVATEVLELAKVSLKRAEVPTSVIVVSEIPRESSGKLRRKTLEQAIGMWTILVKTGLN